MSQYRIEWIQVGKTTTNKVKADATVSDILNETKTDITIWGDYPDFSSLIPGMIVEGELVQSKDGKYKPSLNAPRSPRIASGGAFKQKMATDLIELKDQKIGLRQDDKYYNIKVASTFTAGWNTAIAEWQEQKRVSPHTSQELTALFEKWREYFWYEYDVEEGKKYPPFK